MNTELMQKCLDAAQAIVAAEKELFPGCEDAQNFNTGGGTSETESKFERKGSSTSTQNYGDLPGYLQNLITSNVNASGNDAGLTTQQNALFSALMGRNNDSMPGSTLLQNTMDLPATSFHGASTLQEVAARDPFSAQFETDTQAAYEQRASDAMAQVQSGPDAVRGGNSRSAIGQGVLADRLAQGRGQEVRQAQLQDSAVQGGAAQLFNMIETARRGLSLTSQNQKAGQILNQDQSALGAARGQDQRKISNLGSLQIASDLLGTKRGIQNENLDGSGTQTNSSFNWGVNVLGGCCFIFLQGLNGTLPWFIEKAREDHYTPTRRHGYKWMSNWLVPAMQRWTKVQNAVNAVLIKPFLRYGAWLYKAEGAHWTGALLAPYCKAWLHFWWMLGKVFAKVKVD